MNRLTLLILLVAAVQVYCGPSSKRSWDALEPLEDDKDDGGKVAIKEEDKEILDLGDDSQENDEDKDEKDDYDDSKEKDKEEDKDDKNKEEDKDDKDREDDKDEKSAKNDEEDKFKSELEDLTEVSQAPLNFSAEYGDGQDIVEGDIKMTPEQAALFKRGGWDELVKSLAWRRNHGKWSRTIPYNISGVAIRERRALSASIKMFHDHTCLRFVPKVSYYRDYIQFIAGRGCWSYLGKVRSGAQEVSLGSGCYLAVPAHEIMHALGRYHEQSRADRDRHVRIVTANIKRRYISNFYRQSTADSQSLPYDYLSLMHYGKTAFTKNGQPTIIPIPSQYLTIGQSNRLSLYDIRHINIRYCPERTLRLVGGSGPFQGRVEVFWNEQWGTVCDDGFGRSDGLVICKYLGFPGVVATYHRARFGRGTGPIIMDDLNCVGNEYSPFGCRMRAIGTHNCGHHEDASVTCQKNVRLVGGRVTSSSAYGRLEVYVEGRWGTVCDDYFDINDAKVACRQLGYRRARRVYPRARYGQGRLPILMDDVHCTGYEAQLSHCRSNPIGEHNCRHYEDVSIWCTN